MTCGPPSCRHVDVRDGKSTAPGPGPGRRSTRTRLVKVRPLWRRPAPPRSAGVPPLPPLSAGVPPLPPRASAPAPGAHPVRHEPSRLQPGGRGVVEARPGPTGGGPGAGRGPPQGRPWLAPTKLDHAEVPLGGHDIHPSPHGTPKQSGRTSAAAAAGGGETVVEAAVEPGRRGRPPSVRDCPRRPRRLARTPTLSPRPQTRRGTPTGRRGPARLHSLRGRRLLPSLAPALGPARRPGPGARAHAARSGRTPLCTSGSPGAGTPRRRRAGPQEGADLFPLGPRSKTGAEVSSPDLPGSPLGGPLGRRGAAGERVGKPPARDRPLGNPSGTAGASSTSPRLGPERNHVCSPGAGTAEVKGRSKIKATQMSRLLWLNLWALSPISILSERHHRHYNLRAGTESPQINS